MLKLEAHAKINLTLEILGRRDDGFHEIVSVAQTISLHDTVVIDHGASLEVECEIEGLDAKDNLAYRAADLLREKSKTDLGAKIRIYKRIPVSAGLGGGSADAAAVLVGLNRHWKLKLALRELEGIASELGSDIPFLLTGGRRCSQVEANGCERCRLLNFPGSCCFARTSKSNIKPPQCFPTFLRPITLVGR